jgi:alkanesulfonate monooxygenase SsuD/methylene tetrahydromethanopterin reductase-like flavin-dependent oxidoreductase (luciferase family)
MIDMARRDNLTVAELARQVGGSFSSLEITGTPETIADQMQEWFEGGACDGFNIMFPFLPQGLDDFVDLVVPELQKRGLFRRKYLGRTLREHLGLETPKNQFFL